MRILLFILLIPQLLEAQIGMGEWRLHVPNRKAIDIVTDGTLIFTAFENGLMEYDSNAGEIVMWDNVNGLSDISISSLGFESSTKSVVVGYSNGNIDLIRNNSLTNIPAIVLAPLQGDKKIYKIVEYQNFIYLATGFGIVKIDPEREEVRDTYYPSNSLAPILDIALRGDSIYAITEKKMYSGRLSNPALADPAQWLEDVRVPEILTNTFDYKEIEMINEELYVLYKSVEYAADTVFKVTDSGFEFASPTNFSLEIKGIDNVENRLSVYIDGVGIIFNSDGSYYHVFSPYSPQNFSNPNAAIRLAGNYWLADDKLGLVKYISEGVYENIRFEGPPRNEFFAMDWLKGVLAVVPGGFQSMLPIYVPPGIYFFEDEQWTSKSKEDQVLWQGVPTHDNLSVSINPVNPNQVASGSFSKYGMALIDIDGAVTDTFTRHNSTLEYNSPTAQLYLISDVEFDPDGNLWVLNGFNLNPLKLRTAGGEWFEFFLGSFAAGKQTRGMVVDYNNNVWMSIQNAGLAGYNPGGDIQNASDDKIITLNTGESTGALPSKEVTALAVDFDNELWIGTDNGFAVLYNTEGAFDAGAGGYNAQRIKLEFEGNVEFVLGSTHITDIEVDGGNRKWFGTSNSGVILLSPDGLEIIKQFTMENSPIISNTIIDIEIDHSTGEVFIITDKGLVSYRSDATYEDPEYSDVQIFPNPARPEFDGPITIQGIRYDSDVRITDVAGNLVYRTTSNGGTATWDGMTLQGEKVATGVYLIWTAPNQTKGGYVGKVLVVN